MAEYVVPVSVPQVLLWVALVAAFVVAGWVLWDAWDRLREWWPRWRQHRRDIHRLWVKGAAERDRKHAADLAGRCGR